MQKDIQKVYDALCEFVINATQKDAPIHAVQALPGTLRELTELYKIIRVQKRS